ncbi:prim-pol domain-containing protein [Violaceomyces palustris]|uniref:Prim-pol domain-containing protein n=2 Tax=Violaceomyces palustris TaxID=1673888 RepID=A0ACD0P1B2_9BASI|nr:prim-pol domain-containing protein [Violaceomyces palustris]PWN51807.1 prim-pol domain-containing protein [Violaceomyces palustris]
MPVASPLPAARPPPPEMDVDLDFDDEQDRDAFSSLDERAIEVRESSDPMSMLQYYRRLLPFKQLFTWLNQDLSHQPSRNFTHREFAFTLQNEAYLRYNSFSDADQLKREVCRLNPARFEIGPVYSAKPKDRKTVQKSGFRPTFRELVFDIDMTDYDEVRTCCSGKGICRRCWAFIAVAVRVLDQALREDFGFKHLLWVYSGRRGIHCWVSDREACELADDARKAIVGWLEVIKGSSNQVKKVDTSSTGGGGMGNHPRSLHPSLRRAIGGDGPASGPLKLAFVDTVLKDQDCFRSRRHWETLLQLLPSTETEAVGRLRTKWESSSPHSERSSLEKWSDVMEAAHRSGEHRSKSIWRPCLEDIILQYTYPRIDSEVSKHLNHLLKSPFVVHPATGRVCVPLDPEKVADFDPESDCPTVAQLLRELNSWEAKNGGGGGKPTSNMRATTASRANHSARKAGQGGGADNEDDDDDDDDSKGRTSASSPRQDWEKTSLKPFVELFQRHCSAIVKETRQHRKAQEKFSIDF